MLEGIEGLKLIKEEPHYFGDVPVSVFVLNDAKESIFNSIISLNDAYNELQSSEIDDYNAFVDAFLTLEGVDAESDDISALIGDIGDVYVDEPQTDLL